MDWDILSDRNTKALLLVAHPDDETIFCGGTMLLYPNCQWTVISMTGDGRPQEFRSTMENFKHFGVNIVSYKTLGLQNVAQSAKLSDLSVEKNIWEKILREQNLSPDITLTHNEAGEYGHGAHTLLSVVADDIFPNIWKFIFPPKRDQPYRQRKIEISLDPQILEKKAAIFKKNYISQNYIWGVLHTLMDYEFKNGPEIFTSD